MELIVIVNICNAINLIGTSSHSGIKFQEFFSIAASEKKFREGHVAPKLSKLVQFLSNRLHLVPVVD